MKVFPGPLSAAEEKMYIRRLEEGDPEARAILIENNLRLVAHIVKKYGPGEWENEDLLSVGTIGLIKAVDSYQSSRGSKLSTYAAKCIENAILSQMRLWWRSNLPRAEKNQNGVFCHRFPRISTSFAPLLTAI